MNFWAKVFRSSMKQTSKRISAFNQFTSVIFALFLRELKTRFGDRRFGAFWVIAEPLIHVCFYLVLFVVIRSRMMPQVPFALFLITGLIPYFIFQHTVTGLMSCIDANKALFAYRPVKPIDAYLTRVILEVIIYSTVFAVIIFGFGFFMDLDIIIYHPLKFLGIFSILIVMGFSFGVGASLLVDVLPTAKIIIKVSMMPLYFLSGIMYPLWSIPAEFLHYLQYNPILHLIELLRESYFSHYPAVNGISLAYPLLVTMVSLFIALYFYRYRRLALAARI